MTGTARRPIAVIGAPTSAGAFAPGQEDAPSALREAGVLDLLAATGRGVVDRGDVPRFRWRPDREHPRAQNAAAVVAGARAVAGHVTAALRAGELPLVLGGDCTVGIGTLAGALAAGEDPVLVYFDLHPDLNTPDSVPDGALDWMGLAHMLDEPGAVEELAGLGPRRPLLTPDRVLLLGHDPDHETEAEQERIARLGLRGPTAGDVAADPRGTAAEVARGGAGAAPRPLRRRRGGLRR